jgi:hypothetical protein
MANYQQIRIKYTSQIKALNPNWDLVFLNEADSPNFKYLRAYFRQMKKDFPVKGEFPRLKDFKISLERNFKGPHREYWVLITDQDQPIAGLNYDLIATGPKSYCGLVIFIDVKLKYRQHGLAHLFIKLLQEVAVAEATRYGSKYLGCFAELNDPSKMSAQELKLDYKKSGVKAQDRLLFWKNLGFKKLDFNYIMPSLGFGPVKCLSLSFCPKQLTKSLKAPMLINYLKEFTAFTVSNKRKAAHDQDLRKMIEELKNKKEIKLVKVI